jgi:glycine cleavage system aminomethyltransferase T
LPDYIIQPAGGSYDSDNIDGYYLTPYDLGYGKVVSFKHDFIGKAALEKLKDQPPRWNPVSFGSIFTALVTHDGQQAPQVFPTEAAHYTYYQTEAVTSGDKIVGINKGGSYISPFRDFISLALVAPEYAEPGTEVTVQWGDSVKYQRGDIEDHRIFPVKARVAESPYNPYAREGYRDK